MCMSQTNENKGDWHLTNSLRNSKKELSRSVEPQLRKGEATPDVCSGSLVEKKKHSMVEKIEKEPSF